MWYVYALCACLWCECAVCECVCVCVCVLCLRFSECALCLLCRYPVCAIRVLVVYLCSTSVYLLCCIVHALHLLPCACVVCHMCVLCE